MRRLIIPIAGTLLAFAAAAPTLAQPSPSNRAWTQLDGLRVATAPYHDLQAALDAGFTAFSVDGGTAPTCFDHDGMGMGVHYVRHIDDVVDPLDPEAMVYEIVDPDHLRLVAVEYIVPQEDVEDAQGDVVHLPTAFGQDFHKNPTLPVYVLHAWIWEPNPEGTFADFNPDVSPCPTAASPAPSQVALVGGDGTSAGP